MSLRMLSTVVLVAGIGCTAAPARALAQPESKIDFNRDIRPILSDKCFQCHGPDSTHRKGKLRLDTEEGARVIVRGKPDESELLRRLITEDASERMPPRKSGKTLNKAEIELIRRWIEQGAKFELH